MTNVIEETALINSRRPWNEPVNDIKEYINLQKLGWCYIHFDRLSEEGLVKQVWLGKNKVNNSVYKRELKKYIESFDLGLFPYGEKITSYKQGVLKEGRFMATSPLSLQTIQRGFRHTISEDCLVDIDVVSCHPSIFEYILKPQYNLKFDTLTRYLHHKEDIIAELKANHPNMDKDDIKASILAVLNGGGLTRFENPTPWYIDYYNQAQIALAKIVSQLDITNPSYRVKSELSKGKEYPFLNGSIVNNVLLDYENRIAYYLRKTLEEKGFKIVALTHDGCMVKKNDKLDSALLRHIESVLEDNNLPGISLKYKAMDEGFSIDERSLEVIDKHNKVFQKTVDYEDYNVLKELFRFGDNGMSKIYAYKVKDIIKTTDTGDFSGYKWNYNTRLWNETSKEFFLNNITDVLYPLLKPYLDEVEKLENTKENKVIKKEWNNILKYIQSSNGCKNIWAKSRTELYDEDFKTLLDNVSYEYPIKGGFKVDLRSREVSLRTINDYWTFESPCNYIPGDTPDKQRIFKYLKTVCCEADIQGNDIVRDEEAHFTKWLYKLFGYTLTGEVSDRRMYICHGRGCNSKSVIMDMLSKIMVRGYSALDKSVITQKDKKRSGATPELMSLKTCRVGTVIETDEREKLDASTIKSFTGNDIIVARDLYKKQESFKPKAKIFLITNHKPEINTEDKAIKDRVCFIPFKQTFEKTPENTKKMQDLVEYDIDYFFSLMVDYGSQWWLDKDLSSPQACIEATNEFLEENNDIDPFINDMILLNPTAEQLEEAQLKENHKHKGLYLSSSYYEYTGWCENNNKPCRKQGEFKSALELRGFTVKYLNGNMVIKKDKKHLVLRSKIKEEEIL